MYYDKSKLRSRSADVCVQCNDLRLVQRIHLQTLKVAVLIDQCLARWNVLVHLSPFVYMSTSRIPWYSIFVLGNGPQPWGRKGKKLPKTSSILCPFVEKKCCFSPGEQVNRSWKRCWILSWSLSSLRHVWGPVWEANGGGPAHFELSWRLVFLFFVAFWVLFCVCRAAPDSCCWWKVVIFFEPRCLVCWPFL